MFVRALDIGGSIVRVAASKESIKEHDSVFMEIPLESPPKTYIEDKRSDFIIMQSARPSIIGKRYARGVAMNHYQGRVVVTDNQSAKVEQDSTYVNALYALATELLDSNVPSDDMRVGVDIPVMEFYADKLDYVALLKNGLGGTHTVFFPLLDKTVEIRLSPTSVQALPEGVVAAYAYAKDPAFVNSTTLIVDCGYRSTDITILKQFKPLGKGARSLPVGGINLEALLIGELERMGHMASREEARSAFVTGSISNGRSAVNVEDAVELARSKFAGDLYNSIIDVLSSNMMNIRSINNLLILGRPFIASAGSDLSVMLTAQIPTELTLYKPENLGLANVTETIGVLKRSAAAV